MSIFNKILGSATGEEKGAEKAGQEKSAVEPKKKSVKTPAEPKKTARKTRQNTAAKTTPRRSKVEKKEENQAWRILMDTCVTEKSTALGQFNKYVFKVRPEAGKYEIGKAIEDYYGVRITKVNVLRVKPKKRVQGRTLGHTKAYKKAIVTLQQGDSISTAEGA